jgi:hypothetical protein
MRDVTSNMMIPHCPVISHVVLGTSTLNVISISQTTEFLLTGGIPCIEANLTKVGMERDGMN